MNSRLRFVNLYINFEEGETWCPNQLFIVCFWSRVQSAISQFVCLSVCLSVSWYIYLSKLEQLSPFLSYPNLLHTTAASFMSQRSSQMVPNSLLIHTSTLPSLGVAPPTSLTSPSVQVKLLAADWEDKNKLKEKKQRV